MFVIKYNSIYIKIKDSFKKGVMNFGAEWVENPKDASQYIDIIDAESVIHSIKLFDSEGNYEIVEVKKDDWIELLINSMKDTVVLDDKAIENTVYETLDCVKAKILNTLNENELSEKLKYGFHGGGKYRTDTYYTKAEIEQVFKDIGVL